MVARDSKSFLRDEEIFGTSGSGAGVYSSGNNLTLDNCLVTNNRAFGQDSNGGGIYCEDGILTITNSIVSNNTNGNWGGGLYAEDSEVSLEDCLLQSNRVIEDFGFDGEFTFSSSLVRGGGIYGVDCQTSLRNCSIRANSTFAPMKDGDGGGIFTRVGPSETNNSLQLQNCTFTENVAEGRSPDGSAISIAFGVVAEAKNCTFTKNITHANGNLGGTILCFSSSLNLSHCTIFDNQSIGTALAGLSIVQSNAMDQLTVKSCIIRDNDIRDTSSSSKGTLYTSSLGNNIIGDSGIAAAFEQPGDLIGTDIPILLSPLGDYGGPTQSCLPIPGSPAINRGSSPDPEVPSDQRGLERDSLPDSGAAEFIEATDYPNLFLTDFDGDGIALGLEVGIGTDPTTPDQDNPRNLSVPQFDSTANALLNFNYNPDAPTGTLLIVSRSPDLITFTPLFEFDGQTMTSLENGDTFDLNDTQFTITDTDPLSEKAFYQLKAEHNPPSSN